jgi:hypothetical protein
MQVICRKSIIDNCSNVMMLERVFDIPIAPQIDMIITNGDNFTIQVEKIEVGVTNSSKEGIFVYCSSKICTEFTPNIEEQYINEGWEKIKLYNINYLK